MEECLICGLPLVYETTNRHMECAICHKSYDSRVSCKGGHYVCDACHEKKAVEYIEAYCLQTKETNPISIATALMDKPYVHMHGNEHHVLVGAALLAAYSNAGGKIALDKAMKEMVRRGKEIPGGVCGFWGACGAGISTGIFISIITGSTPLSEESWGLANTMTSQSLAAIGAVGGPRCCKRDSFSAIRQAVLFCRDVFHISMTLPERIACTYSARNNQCLGRQCPYYSANSSRDGDERI